MQLRQTAAIGRGLQVNASYTWSKSIDTGSSTIAGDQFANSISSLLFFDSRRNSGLSDFNIGQTLSLHFTYDFPTPASRGARWTLVKNWRLSGTYQASTGAPFTPVLSGDPLGSKSADPYDVPNAVARAGCGNPVNPGRASGYLKLECFAFPSPATLFGNLGRNALVGPSLSTAGISVFKDNFIKRVSDTLNLQLRFEAFNLLNHPNLAPPLNHRALFDASGNAIPGAGLIDATATPSRQMQTGLKIIW